MRHRSGLYNPGPRHSNFIRGGRPNESIWPPAWGTRLVNTLFVLDEPTVGLHPRDTRRLVHIMEQLRDAGNTVVVVEHESAVMRAADQIIDLGPAAGSHGGELVFQGTLSELLKSNSSTGQHLSGRKSIPTFPLRPVEPGVTSMLTIRDATQHNIRNLTVHFPLNRLICISGVSGSGKTTLIRELLFPALAAKFNPTPDSINSEEEESQDEGSDNSTEKESASDGLGKLEGWEQLRQCRASGSIHPKKNTPLQSGCLCGRFYRFARLLC